MVRPHAVGIVVLLVLTLAGLLVISGAGTATGFVSAARVDNSTNLPPASLDIAPTGGGILAASACTPTRVHFYIVHLGPDHPEIAWTLQEKYDHTRQAFQDANTIYHDALAAQGYANIELTAQYTVIVRHDAVVNIPGVNVIKIPEEQLPKPDAPWGTCLNQYRLCFANKPLSEFYAGLYANYTTMDLNIAFRDTIGYPVGAFETTLKTQDTIPFVITDGLKHANTISTGWGNTEKGVITLAYPPFWDDQAKLFNQVLYSRTVAHELGHMFGVGHNDKPDMLMTSIAKGGTGYELDLYEAARIRATHCSPGLMPAIAGVVNKVDFTNEDSCKKDTLLHRQTGLMEECNPAFSGYFNPGEFMGKSITQFCPIVEINGQILAQPLAVTDDPSHPNFYKKIVLQNPGAVISQCTPACDCVPLSASGGVIIGPITPPNGGGGGGGGKLNTPNSGSNQTPPTTAYCGDGLVTGGEDCDPPGETCGLYCVEGTMYVDKCNHLCECVPGGTGTASPLCSG